MRIFEIVQRDLRGLERVVVDAPEGEDLLPALRLPDGVEVVTAAEGQDAMPVDVAGDVEADALLLLAVDVSADSGRLATGLARIAPNGSAVVLVGEPAPLLPVGRLVDAVTTAGLQVRAVTPLSSPRWPVAVSVTRTDELLPLHGYLVGEPAVELGIRQLLRLVAEQQLEAFALRSRLDGDGNVLERDPDAAALPRTGAERRAEQLTEQLSSQLAELQLQLTAARSDSQQARRELRQVQQRLQAVESSASLALGRALVAARRHPLDGARGVLRVVRGRGQARG